MKADSWQMREVDISAPSENPSRTVSPTPSADLRRVPGDPGSWILIIGDMIVFGILFATFLYYRAQQPDLFAQSQHELNRVLGSVNTVLLLTSSWFIAEAVHGARKGSWKSVPRHLDFALLCSAGFMGVKAIEYGEKISSGISLSTDDFFFFYFAMTGLHLFHLIAASCFLIFARSRLSAASGTSSDLLLLETAGSFWHLVDLLWIMLFALIYLVR